MGERVRLGTAAKALGVTIHALRKRRERYRSFPAPVEWEGHIPLYDLDDLRSWEAENPEAATRGRPRKGVDRASSTYRRASV